MNCIVMYLQVMLVILTRNICDKEPAFDWVIIFQVLLLRTGERSRCCTMKHGPVY